MKLMYKKIMLNDIMNPLKSLVIFFIFLFGSYIETFINTAAVFTRRNDILKRHNYIITDGDIHEVLYNLNNDQIKEIKSLVYNSDPHQTLFLVEDIASIKTPHPLLNNVVQKINETYNNTTFKNRIPIITLVNYALANKKNAINIDDRAHTLIQTSFYDLLISYILKTKYILLPQQYLSICCGINLREIGLLLNDFLQKCEKDYLEVSEKLKTLENNILNHPQQLDEINDLKRYIEFYNSFSEIMKKDKEYADSLISRNIDLITYLVNEYKIYKNSNQDIVSYQDVFNFKMFAESTFLNKILNFGAYGVELKALKLIIENLNSRPKIFVFTGQKHTDKLNEILEKMSFKKIYKKTQTQNLHRIYDHISNHILQAGSINKINNNYILKIKENLKPIDHNFFKICQKRHLHKEDFKTLR